jgi:6-pyruvoyltetrahydropterin/6-carboxytetrahydropterin synthase
MIIRKKYEVESAHIVRNCTSERCSHSIHGHSAVIEVFLESTQLDNAQMVYDFGLMKSTIKQIIDSMDHCYLLCTYDDDNFKNFIKSTCDRWIELPFNPSAEMLSMFVFDMVSRVITSTKTNNGEGEIKVKAVRYHETQTGYAECNENDMLTIYKLGPIYFSEGVVKDWSSDLVGIMSSGKQVDNPVILQQIDLNPQVEEEQSPTEGVEEL